MAKKSEVDVKSALAAAVVQINLALEDDTLSSNMAQEFRGYQHPMRKLDQLFTIDKSTGQYTSDLDFISKAYNGTGARSTSKNQGPINDIV